MIIDGLLDLIASAQLATLIIESTLLDEVEHAGPAKCRIDDIFCEWTIEQRPDDACEIKQQIAITEIVLWVPLLSHGERLQLVRASFCP